MAISWPIRPLAPARLSITVCWPMLSASRWATRRDAISVALPAVLGTMIRIGRTG
jgi:hypothetical protein